MPRSQSQPAKKTPAAEDPVEEPVAEDPAEVAPAPEEPGTAKDSVPVHHIDTYGTGSVWGWRAMAYTDVVLKDSGLQYADKAEALGEAPALGEFIEV